MNDEEKQVLHGLYRFLWTLHSKALYPFTPLEIIWLMRTPIPETADWQLESGQLRKWDRPISESYLTEQSHAMLEAERPLSYLASCGYIDYEKRDQAGTFAITFKHPGAELARKLDSRFGRLDLWYRAQKEGLLGILVTAVVSIIISIVTAYLTTRYLHTMGK